MAGTGMFSAPWDWLPDGLASVDAPAPMQPGIGIPSGLIEQAIGYDPNEIQMDGTEPTTADLDLAAARAAGAPYIGPPRAWSPDPPASIDVVDAGPPIEPAPDAVIDPNGWDPALTGAPMPDPAPVDVGMSQLAPGLGIPEGLIPSIPIPAPDRLSTELESPRLPWAEDGAEFAALSPEAQAREMFASAQQSADEERRRLIELATADDKKAEEIRTAYKIAEGKATADTVALDAEARSIAATREDPDRWKDNRSGGQWLASVLAAVGGGLVQHLNGNRNFGTEAIERNIERDIAAQRGDLANRRAMLGDRRASVEAGRDNAQRTARDEDLYRVSQLGRAIERVKTDMLSFDERGTQRIEYGKLLIGLDASRTAALEGAKKRRHDELIGFYESENKRLDAVKTMAEIQKLQAEAGKLKGGTGGAGGTTGKLAPDQWEKLYGSAGRPPEAMTAKEHKEWITTGNKLSQGAFHSTQAAKAARENSPEWIAGELGAGDLANEDGTPILFRDATSAGRVAKKRGAVDSAARLIDQLAATRKKYGWSSALLKSPEWRESAADMGALIIAQKNDAELGALSGPDMELIEQMLTTTNPTGILDPTPGLKRARFNSINSLNDVIGSEARPGSKPKRYEINTPTYTSPTESEEDRILARGLAEVVSPYTAFVSDQDNIAPNKREKRTYDENVAAYKAAGGLESIPPTIKAQIATWESEARSGNDDVSKKARAYLMKLGSDGGSPQIRAAASVAIGAANSPIEPERGPVTSTVRDTISLPPPEPKKKGKK